MHTGSHKEDSVVLLFLDIKLGFYSLLLILIRFINYNESCFNILINLILWYIQIKKLGLFVNLNSQDTNLFL